ncbi:MAG: hypothetical protein EBZ59_12260 [Planctomycetia bacterium]|nr:hypothetical protein [Planctomycetia bacterium]
MPNAGFPMPLFRAPTPGVISLRVLCSNLLHGGARLAALAQDGRLRPEHLWVAAKGAGRYVTAVALGDEAGEELREARLRACQQCPSRTGIDLESYCGPAFEDRLDHQPPTCGCLCAGKASVKSERCPQNNWPE